MKSANRILATAATAMISIGSSIGISHAAVSADEAKQLGGPVLTLTGAEKAGNKEGTIPPYTGDPIKVPATYDPKNPARHPDPFNEKPLFSITAQNYTKYLDKIDAYAEMFKRFPNYRMDIYPSHRNYVYPKYVLDNTVKNATSCKGVDGELRLEGCYAGVPFPIPKTGEQAMWNHLLQYEAPYYDGGITNNFVVPTSGNAVENGFSRLAYSYPIYDPKKTGPMPSNSIFWLVRTQDLAPARKAGGSVVLIDSLDMINIGRRAYSYIPGQRRVKLAPDLQYDTPSPYSGGSATMDDQKVFLGAMDRFTWKLIGKKEKYIPYNTYNVNDFKVCPAEMLVSTKNFPNPDCVRWELHRVWVVEAKLKPGYRHVYSTRKFYWDEDAPGAGVGENYDAAGKLFRLVASQSYPFYETPGGTGGVAGTGSFNTDLITGVAATSGTTGGCIDCGAYPNSKPYPMDFFSPDAMAGGGVR